MSYNTHINKKTCHQFAGNISQKKICHKEGKFDGQIIPQNCYNSFIMYRLPIVIHYEFVALFFLIMLM